MRLGLQPLVRRGFIRKPPVTARHNCFFLCRKTACSKAISALFLSANRLYIAEITGSFFRKQLPTFHAHDCPKQSVTAQHRLLSVPKSGLSLRERLFSAQSALLPFNTTVAFSTMTKLLAFLSHKQLITSPTDREIHHNLITDISGCFSPSFPNMQPQLLDFIVVD